MKKNNYGGYFIVFEGLDGSGQSTQMGLLADFLLSQGYSIHITKEPTNNIVGGIIRGQLSKDWTASMECLQLLFAADRAHHLEKEIIPALKRKMIVLCDRYIFSGIAFGSIKSDKKWLIELNKNFILPDLTILLDVSASECIRRMKEVRLDLELFEEKKKLEKVLKNYRSLSKNFNNVIVINGKRRINQVSGEIREIVKRKLASKGITKKSKLV
jgi:dTMP kinase